MTSDSHPLALSQTPSTERRPPNRPLLPMQSKCINHTVLRHKQYKYTNIYRQPVLFYFIFMFILHMLHYLHARSASRQNARRTTKPFDARNHVPTAMNTLRRSNRRSIIRYYYVLRTWPSELERVSAARHVHTDTSRDLETDRQPSSWRSVNVYTAVSQAQAAAE